MQIDNMLLSVIRDLLPHVPRGWMNKSWFVQTAIYIAIEDIEKNGKAAEIVKRYCDSWKDDLPNICNDQAHNSTGSTPGS